MSETINHVVCIREKKLEQKVCFSKRLRQSLITKYYYVNDIMKSFAEIDFIIVFVITSYYLQFVTFRHIILILKMIEFHQKQ